MPEAEPPIEHNELTPTEESILSIFQEILGDPENFTEERKTYEGKEVCIWEVSVHDSDPENEGGKKVCTYMRAGEYPGGSSADTVIDVVFYKKEERLEDHEVIYTPISGCNVAKFQEGQWVYES